MRGAGEVKVREKQSPEVSSMETNKRRKRERKRKREREREKEVKEVKRLASGEG